MKTLSNFLADAHTETELLTNWFDENAIEVNEDIKLPEFKLLDIVPLDDCNSTTYTYARGIDGNAFEAKFSCLVAQFQLKRQIGFHLVQTYVPTGVREVEKY